MGTPVQAGEPEVVALAETIVMRPGVPSRTAALTRPFPRQVAV